MQKIKDNRNASVTVIVADGRFPEHLIPVGYLENAERIICCDGAAESLLNFGLEPYAIIGDCDSIRQDILERLSDRIYIDSEQETNDLTKAVRWCKSNGYTDIVILGATGNREDHTLGNISLLADYINDVNVIMVTDTGTFIPFLESCKIETFPGQQISVFSIDPETRVSSFGLKYVLSETRMTNWWVATLNEATGNTIELSFTGGPIILFMKFKE
jgi:thiamine pyrophosphokinase